MQAGGGVACGAVCSMALRQLAGPFAMGAVGGQTAYFGVTNMFWWPGVGVIADLGISASTFPYQCVITFDGVYADISKFFGWYVGIGWDYERAQRVVSQNNTGDVYFDQHGLLAVQWPDRAYPELDYTFVDLRDGRRIYCDGSRIYSYNKLTAQTVLEYPPTSNFTALGYGNNFYAHPGRDEGELFLIGAGTGGTRCMFYNIEQKTLSNLMWLGGLSAEGVCFAIQWGIIASIHNTGSDHHAMRIWSLEVIPATLTDPVAVDATECKGGHVATYMVQAKGDKADLCVGEHIEWEIVSGPGVLLDTQSVTGDDGKAYARVRYGVYDSGNMVIKASLTC